MALFDLEVQFYQSHAPKTNFPSVGLREDCFYSLNAAVEWHALETQPAEWLLAFHASA